MKAGRKVIFVPFMTGFGGVERLALGMSRYLTERGSAHCVVTFSNDIDLGSYAEWPIDVVVLQAARNPVLEGLALRRWVAREIRSQRLTHPILVFDLKGAFYAAFVAAAYAVHVTDPPSLLSADISKHAPSKGTGWKSSVRHPGMAIQNLRAEGAHFLNGRGLRRATILIAMTKRIAREIREVYGLDARVIPPGIRPPASLPVRDNNGSAIRFLSISRLVASKRIDWILNELATDDSALRSEGIEWSFEVIGSGPDGDRLAALAHSLGLDSSVTFSGLVDEKEIERAYSNATIFLMPAAQGWGLPALEALSRGVPVVIHEDSGVTEILPASPWVELINDPAGGDLGDAMARLARRVRNGGLADVTPPSIPLENDWAEMISTACSWFSVDLGTARNV